MGDVLILPDHFGSVSFTGGRHQNWGPINLTKYGILS